MSDLITYARSFLGTPYMWGGNSRVMGLDCGGFICEILRRESIIGLQDYSAQGLHDFLLKSRSGDVVSRPCQAGDLLFWGDPITHVAMAIDDKYLIEAGGGDSSTKTIVDAAKRNACVRERKMNYRKDPNVIIRPRYQ